MSVFCAFIFALLPLSIWAYLNQVFSWLLFTFRSICFDFPGSYEISKHSL